MTSNLPIFCLGALLLSSFVLNQSEGVVVKSGNIVDGKYISISQNSLVSVTEVTGKMVTTKNVGYLGVQQQLRPPCVTCPYGYNILWVNVTNETNRVIVPDDNALKIANEDGKYEETVTLRDCDPYLLHPLSHDHSILWVLCNPFGNQARVYRVSLTNLSTEPPLVVHTDSGPFFSQVGEIFEQAGTLHVILAVAKGLAFASQDNPRAQLYTLEKTCSSVLRMTGLDSTEILIECGNRASRTVENTYLLEYDDFHTTDVHLRPDRELGKIITSDDASILASVAPQRIDILERNQGHVTHVRPSPNHEFHDAYIESVAGSHLMVYSDKRGKVHLYDISTALNGKDVSPQTIEGNYVTCENCSGLVWIRERYFVTATDRGGMAWFSTTPPELLRTSGSVKADRLAYSPSTLTSENVNSLDYSRIVGGVIGGVAGPMLFVILVVVAVVGVVCIWKKPWRNSRPPQFIPQPPADHDVDPNPQVVVDNPLFDRHEINNNQINPDQHREPVQEANRQDHEEPPAPEQEVGNGGGVLVANNLEADRDGRGPIPGEEQPN